MELYTVPLELDHYQHPPCLILYIQSPGVWVHKQYLLSHRTSIGPIYTSPLEPVYPYIELYRETLPLMLPVSVTLVLREGIVWYEAGGVVGRVYCI